MVGTARSASSSTAAREGSRPRRLTPGTTWQITNHYLPADHKSGCGGTTVRTVLRANTTGVYLTIPSRPDDERGSFVKWPKASDLESNGDAIRVYRGGAAQGPGDLFLTIVPA